MREKIKFKSTRIVSAEEDSKEILYIAQQKGIKIPSSHLGFFKTVYAKIEEPNLNKIRLGAKAVQEALPGLIGSQVNFEHLGAGFLCGTILDAWINELDEIEVVYSFFKSIYPDEYAQSIELAKEKELSVSFELLSERESQEFLNDGTIRLNDIDFQGMGHLMSNPPACPQAKIYEFASQCKERLSKIEDRELVFASQIEEKCDEILSIDEANMKEVTMTPTLPESTTDSDKHKDILANQKENEDKSEQGGNTIVTEEQKAKVEELRTELGDFAKEISDEDLLDETVVAELRKEKEAKEEATIADVTEETTEEETVEETVAEVEKPKEESEVAEEETAEIEEAQKPTDDAESEIAKQEEELAYKLDSVEIRTFSLEEKDGIETVVESIDRITISDYNAMQDAKAKVEELEKSLEAKDLEIETVKANAEKIATTKLQLKDNPFIIDFADEDYLDDEKVAKAVQDKTDADTLATLKEELKDNSYAKDFTDEDYLNTDKVELAKVRKEKDELEAKPEPEKIEASEKIDEEMDTGAVVDEKDDYSKVIASIRKDNTEKRHTQKVYTRK